MKRFYLMCIALMGLSGFLHSQTSVVHLTEISGKKKVPIPNDTTATIVDINSDIHLQLQIAQIETAFLTFQGLSADDKRLEKLEKLNKILEREVRITAYLNSGFKKNGASIEEQLDYFEGLYSLQNDLLMDLRSTDTTLFKQLNSIEAIKAYNAFNGIYVEFVLSFLNQKAQELREDILGSLGLSDNDSALQVFFRLGAFIRDKRGGRPIHVENFDNYDKENYQEVARFGAPISDAEKKAINENARLNNELDQGIEQSIENFKGAVKGYTKKLFAFKNQYKQLDSTYKSNLQKLSKDPKTESAADVLRNNPLGLNLVDALYSTLSNQFDDLARLFSPNVSRNERIDETLNTLEQTVVGAYTTFNKSVFNFNQKPEAEGSSELIVVDGTYKQYVDSTKQSVTEIRGFFQKLRDITLLFRKAYLENENFGKKVKRFKIGEIPKTGLIELNYIGRISSDDQILIKASLERGTDRNHPDFKEEELFRKEINIDRIRPYIKMSGSIIMANPYNREKIPAIDLENDFQFAPTYGIIFKWGTRKSSFYNNFINLGVGVAFSSPDFNTDGTPEFGAGIMLTAFKDLLSIGWGRNFGLDASYTFIGFNIPFSVGGLPSENAGRFENP